MSGWISEKISTDVKIRDLQLMFNLEYFINRMNANPTLGFTPTVNELKAIKMECTQFIREYLFKTRDVNILIPPTAFGMLWESLYALSDVQGGNPTSISEFSIHVTGRENTIGGKIFSFGLNPYGYISQNIKLYLIQQGVNPKHIAFQWIDLHLKTRGAGTFNIDEYIKVLNKPLSAVSGSSSTSTMSSSQWSLAKDITWTMSCGRSWLTGNPIDRDDVLVHHILHDKTPSPNYGKTLYGGFYDTIRNLAAIEGKSENQIVEGQRKWNIEALLIQTWVSLLNGKPPSHWSKNNQQAFVKQRRSKVYITNYARKIPNVAYLKF